MSLKKKNKIRPSEEVEVDIKIHLEKLYGKKKPFDISKYNKERAKKLKEFHSWYR